jgi:hypothetical protein
MALGVACVADGDEVHLVVWSVELATDLTVVSSECRRDTRLLDHVQVVDRMIQLFERGLGSISVLPRLAGAAVAR